MNRKKDNSKAETSRIVQSHDIQLDNEYITWIAELKDRYRSAQTKAAVKVNAEKLMFNWQLGRDLVQKKAEERWGSGVVEQVSLDLKKAFPNADGFSTSNLWYMKNGLFSAISAPCNKIPPIVLHYYIHVSPACITFASRY